MSRHRNHDTLSLATSNDLESPLTIGIAVALIYANPASTRVFLEQASLDYRHRAIRPDEQYNGNHPFVFSRSSPTAITIEYLRFAAGTALIKRPFLDVARSAVGIGPLYSAVTWIYP